MPFVYKGSVENANSGRLLREELLADSTTFTVGDALRFDGTTGTLILAGAGNAVAGILVGFKAADGSLITDDGNGGNFVDTYLTPSSNTVRAVIDVSKDSLYTVTADDTLGTTTGSDVIGTNLDLVAASDQLDESTVQAAGTSAQFFSFGTDPDPEAPTDSLLVKIQESQLDL